MFFCTSSENKTSFRFVQIQTVCFLCKQKNALRPLNRKPLTQQRKTHRGKPRQKTQDRENNRVQRKTSLQDQRTPQTNTQSQQVAIFFWLGAAWVKSRAERPSVSGVNRQLHVQIGCKLGIRNRKDELTKQAK